MIQDETLAAPERVRRAGVRGRAVPLTLLALQGVGWGILFPVYAFARDSLQLQALAVGLALLGLWTVYAVWSGRSGAPWAVLTLVSLKLVLDLFNWSLNLDRRLLPVSELINGGLLVWAFRPFASTAHLTRAQKRFFGSVLVLAAWVAAWGILVPAAVDWAIPFMVPPLHARFLGAMYLSGATFMLLGLRATRWAEMRVTVPMIAIWTGMLGIVSLLHLEAFDWTMRPTWVWFVAYTAFPIIAAWIAWQQRAQREAADGPGLGAWPRWLLVLLGAPVTVLALALLLAPAAMVALWPWAISPLLAQIYSAPFLAYGLGSLLAARQHRWAEVRIPVVAMLVFALGVLLASLRHAALFTPGAPATWLWFGGFGAAALGLAVCVGAAARESAAATPAGPGAAAELSERQR